VPRLEPVHDPACRAPTPIQRTTLDISLPGSMLRVAAADPPYLVITAQGHLTGQFCIPCVVPLLGQVWPPNRQYGVVRNFAVLSPTLRAASVDGTPVIAGSLVWWMALQTHPLVFCFATSWSLDGRGVAGMPFPVKHGVFSHRLALTEITPSPAFARGAYNVTSILCQEMNSGLPLMVPATSMVAAWAAQPDPFIALVGKTGWQFAQVLGWVPHALNQLVVRVRQRLLALVIVAYACNCGGGVKLLYRTEGNHITVNHPLSDRPYKRHFPFSDCLSGRRTFCPTNSPPLGD